MVGVGNHVPRVLPGDGRLTKDRLGRNTLNQYSPSLVPPSVLRIARQRHVGQLLRSH